MSLATPPVPKNVITADEALQLLKEGNERFCRGLRSIESMATPEKIRDLAAGQRPFAIIVGCSDSRVPAEIVFDRGVGDLFLIRLAGNIVPSAALASVEFAALNFGTPLVVVLGHTECGAIKAAVDTITSDAMPELTHSLSELVGHIAPSVRSAAFDNASKPEVIRRATLDNIRRGVADVYRNSEALRPLIDEGRLSVVGALYDLHTGQVEFDPVAV
jgi:carbonic anhydrase